MQIQTAIFFLHIHMHIYVYKMAPGSNQQPWFAILNFNFEMYSVRVRCVLRCIRLNVSCALYNSKSHLLQYKILHKSKI